MGKIDFTGTSVNSLTLAGGRHLRGPARGIHDVSEEYRAENPIVGHVGLLTGEEFGDRLERRSPVGFDEVDSVAPRVLNVLPAQ